MFATRVLGALVLIVAALCGNSGAERRVQAYFFKATGCPHCNEEEAFLQKMKERYPGLEVSSFEVRHDKENARLMSRLAGAHGLRLQGVPAIFVGDFAPVIGFRGEETTGLEIEEKVLACMKRDCPDPMVLLSAAPALLLPGGEAEQEGICPQDLECPEEQAAEALPAQPAAGGDNIIRIPFLGEVDISGSALPVQTVIIAAMDSFNPCAFFVLFMLLGLLIHAGSRGRLLLIGGIFVFFSGLVYFVFMAAWLNVFLAAGQVAAVTVAAGVVALVIALINIKDYFLYRRGVSLTIPDSARSGLFDRMRRLLKATSLLSVIAGTVVLALAANTYELFCTAGFPMVYTRILTLHDLPAATYYIYLALYNLVYIIPLAVIVAIFSVTLGSRKLSERQGRVLKLVSGMMMLGLGGVLLLRPELLSNIAVTGGVMLAALSASLAVVFITRRAAAHR